MFAVILATVFLAFVSATPHCPPDLEDVVLLPNPDDCASYYACDDGVAYLMNCSVGLLFNPELRVCDWANNVTCPDNSSTSPVPDEKSSEESSEGPSEESSEEPSEKHSEEPDDELDKIPDTKPCKASSESSESNESSESSEESDELTIYK